MWLLRQSSGASRIMNRFAYLCPCWFPVHVCRVAVLPAAEVADPWVKWAQSTSPPPAFPSQGTVSGCRNVAFAVVTLMLFAERLSPRHLAVPRFKMHQVLVNTAASAGRIPCSMLRTEIPIKKKNQTPQRRRAWERKEVKQGKPSGCRLSFKQSCPNWV